MGEAGAFEGVDAALMVHPADQDLLEMSVIAIATWEVEYFGEAAHAAAFPHLGRNALDAAVLGYNAVAAQVREGGDRKSTRLNSTHRCISYAILSFTKT